MKVIKRLMKKLLLIALILFAGNATASSLPNCPSNYPEKWDNCIGTKTYPNGDKYIGGYKDGNRDGLGTYTYTSGSKYVGEHKDGEKHGQGTYTWADGDKYVGEIKFNKFHGQGTYTFANGVKESGYYMNGKYIPTICENMGLTKGTESFGQCVLKLIDKVYEDD